MMQIYLLGVLLSLLYYSFQYKEDRKVYDTTFGYCAVLIVTCLLSWFALVSGIATDLIDVRKEIKKLNEK